MTDEMWQRVGLLLPSNSISITVAACTLLGSAKRQVIPVPCPEELTPKPTQSKRAPRADAFSGNGFELYWQNITVHTVQWPSVILQWLDVSLCCSRSGEPCCSVFHDLPLLQSCLWTKSHQWGACWQREWATPQLEVWVCVRTFKHNSCLSAQWCYLSKLARYLKTSWSVCVCINIYTEGFFSLHFFAHLNPVNIAIAEESTYLLLIGCLITFCSPSRSLALQGLWKKQAWRGDVFSLLAVHPNTYVLRYHDNEYVGRA